MMEKQRAQAWCFENGITEAQIQSAWDNAIAKKNVIISSLASHGETWHKLAPHLLHQLIDRYGVEAEKGDE